MFLPNINVNGGELVKVDILLLNANCANGTNKGQSLSDPCRSFLIMDIIVPIDLSTLPSARGL